MQEAGGVGVCAAAREEKVGLHDKDGDAADRDDFATAEDQLVVCGNLRHATPCRNMTASSRYDYSNLPEPHHSLWGNISRGLWRGGGYKRTFCARATATSDNPV